MSSCECNCKPWFQYIIDFLPTILMFLMVGGGGATAIKYRDKLKKLFDNRVVNRIFPKPVQDIEMGKIERNVTSTSLSPRRGIEYDTLEMIAAKHVLEMKDRRKSLA